jgi:hypothetical protein
MRKYCMGDFGQENNSAKKAEADYYGVRVNQMQPAMVEFQTEDSVERELRYELSNLDTESEFYYETDESSDFGEQGEVQSEDSTVNMVKPTLEQAAKVASDAQAPKPANKALVYGGVAALAALMFFGQD